MIRYRDWDNDSGVRAFDIGPSHIDIEFKSGAIYRYTSMSVGARNLDTMIQLAKAGDGLNAFIQKAVKDNFSARLR
ncbi:MAG: hypothetical protein Salg2KO_21860 [Salibacteraceae bacterium]